MSFRERRRARRARRRQRRASRPPWVGLLVVGSVMVGLGLLFLVSRFWPGMPGLDRLWPVFPMAGGMLFLLQYLAGGLKEPGLVFPGVAALGVGFFFFLFTLGPFEYEQMERLWPVFPLIGGIAFFWTWIASFGRKIGLLVPAVLSGCVGVVGLLFTVTPVGPAVALLGWPLLLIGIGFLFVLLAGVAALLRGVTAGAMGGAGS